MNAKDDRGMSPLQLASAFGNLPLVELLLSNKADVASADAFGFTALHSAVFFGRVHIVDVLLKTKADLGAVTKSGDTPLSLAELGGNFVLVGKLKARTVQNISDEMPKLEKAVSTKKGWGGIEFSCVFEMELKKKKKKKKKKNRRHASDGADKTKADLG